MKKCAQAYGVRTESLVDLIKKQQEKLERELERGFVPSDV
jgi:hypothetical protein